MDERTDEEKEEQSRRLTQMRKALDYDTQKDWADAIGIMPKRWENMESGRNPVSRDVATKIVTKFPGLTRDYLQAGDTRGLTLEMLKTLGLLPKGSSLSG